MDEELAEEQGLNEPLLRLEDLGLGTGVLLLLGVSLVIALPLTPVVNTVSKTLGLPKVSYRAVSLGMWVGLCKLSWHLSDGL